MSSSNNPPSNLSCWIFTLYLFGSNSRSFRIFPLIMGIPLSLSSGLFEIFVRVFLAEMGSSWGRRLNWFNCLIISYLSVNCPTLGLHVRNTSCLPCMVIIEKVISFHKLLSIDFTQRSIHRNFTQVYCTKNRRSKSFSSCRPNPLIFVKLLVLSLLLFFIFFIEIRWSVSFKFVIRIGKWNFILFYLLSFNFKSKYFIFYAACGG